MANEAVIVELLGNRGDPIDLTIVDTATIGKGTVMSLGDPRSGAATLAAGTGEISGGIAAADKVASDGQLNLACYQYGIFDLKVNPSEAVTLGAKVTNSGANLIRDATAAECDAGAAIGKALETGAVNEVIEVLVAPVA